MREVIKKDWPLIIAISFFSVITVWWIILQLSGVKEQFQNYLFGGTYGLIAVYGGILGIFIAQKWGGFKSSLGRFVYFIAFGLFVEEFGQLAFTSYNLFLKIQVPYPSIADIGFFGLIPFYILAVISLAHTVGLKFSLKSIGAKLQLVFIPVIMLVATYALFLQDYTLDFSNPIKILLDFGYPLGHAIYISITILILSLSRKYLGGIMRNTIFFFLFAFLLQYVAEFNFLFQSSRGTWANAGYGDYLYFLAYSFMTLAIIQLNYILIKIK